MRILPLDRATTTMASGSARAAGEAIEADVAAFLARNFPQIAMHGGTAAIDGIDPETGEVRLRLDGACAGCGISPVTVHAIETRLVSEIPSGTAVSVDTGGGLTPVD